MNIIIYGPHKSGKTTLMDILAAGIQSKTNSPPTGQECGPQDEPAIRRLQGGIPTKDLILTCLDKDLLWLTNLLDRLGIHVDRHIYIGPAKSYIAVNIGDLTWLEAMREMQAMTANAQEDDEGV